MPKKTYFEINQEDQHNISTAVQTCHGMSDESAAVTSWKTYTRSSKRLKTEREPRIVTAQVGDMNYIGKNFSSNLQTIDNTCNYYIGVINKESGKLRVLPAELFQLHPFIEDNSVNQTSASLQTYREKTDDLVKEFGSGKMQRALKKRQTNKLDSDMLSTATKNATENTTIVKDEEAGLSTPSVVTATSAVPPFNINAQRPEDVYKASDIISPGMVSGLDEMAESLIQCSAEETEAWAREKTYSGFVLTKLQSLSVREDVRRLQCQCLVYIDCLMKVFVMKYNQLKLKDPLPKDWNILVKKHIFSTFFVEVIDNGRKKRSLPGQRKDLMLSHILVLCLKLSNFSLSVDSLLADLNLAKKRLTTHCQILGCTVKLVKDSSDSSVTSHWATLSVPLKFPEQKNHKAKKFT